MAFDIEARLHDWCGSVYSYAVFPLQHIAKRSEHNRIATNVSIFISSADFTGAFGIIHY